MSRIGTAAGGFLAGATFMYFTDPKRGKRRRAIARDKTVAGWKDVRHEVDKARRDVWNRAHGAVAGARSLWKNGDAEIPVLEGRVRSRIGRAVSHPRAVEAKIEEGGRVVLEGPVLENELEYLLHSVKSVPGVHEVINRLEVHAEPGNISSLQGGVPRRQCSELAQDNWTPALRVTAGAVAGALFYSSLRNDGLTRLGGVMGGALLLARAVANVGFRQMFGLADGPGAVHFEKTVHIDAPVDEVFVWWSNFENFPRFMTHIREARDLGTGRSHWVAEGPAGISIPWDAEVTKSIPNELLAWRSVPGSLIDNAGVVRFDMEPNGSTRLTIRMSYSPPAGLFGHAVAALFGADPRSEINDDMVRLKSLLETGKTRAHGARVTREEIAIAQA